MTIMINKISIIGGDLRTVKLVEMLIEEGVEVYSYALENAEDIPKTNKCEDLKEAIDKSKIILGPIPFSSNGNNINTPFSSKKILVTEFLDSISEKTLIGGQFKQEIYELAQERNIKLIDISKREDLSVLNAVSTAEGTIKIAIEETPRNLHGSDILILGFGRTGKVISNMLKGLGAKVSCEARKNSDLAWIKAYGYEPIPLANLKENLHRYDIIINTIPYIVLDRTNLEQVKRDALVIDLASNPGGVDKGAIKEQKIKFIWALSLPGKISPVTSAEFIKETLYNIYNELKGE